MRQNIELNTQTHACTCASPHKHMCSHTLALSLSLSVYIYIYIGARDECIVTGNIVFFILHGVNVSVARFPPVGSSHTIAL
jgi:hypothetical protein